MDKLPKKIKECNDYLIYQDGRVYSYKSNGFLRAGPTSNGYYTVSLYLSGKASTYYIARLVAEYFLENPDNLPEVNHKDGDKSNNHVDNLEFCTRNQNMQHAHDLGLYDKKGEKNGNSRLSEPIVKKIRYLFSQGNLKYTDLAKIFNVTPVHIRLIVLKKQWACVD